MLSFAEALYDEDVCLRGATALSSCSCSNCQEAYCHACLPCCDQLPNLSSRLREDRVAGDPEKARNPSPEINTNCLCPSPSRTSIRSGSNTRNQRKAFYQDLNFAQEPTVAARAGSSSCSHHQSDRGPGRHPGVPTLHHLLPLRYASLAREVHLGAFRRSYIGGPLSQTAFEVWLVV